MRDLIVFMMCTKRNVCQNSILINFYDRNKRPHVCTYPEPIQKESDFNLYRHSEKKPVLIRSSCILNG